MGVSQLLTWDLATAYFNLTMDGPTCDIDANESDPAKPLSLTTLPPELLLFIIGHLRTDDRLVIRTVSRLFANFIPAPTHADLLQYETAQWAVEANLFTCGGCLRLRHENKFNCGATERFFLEEHNQERACSRFCKECGVRDLPGDFRYGSGDVWYDKDGVHGVRVMRVKRLESQTRTLWGVSTPACVGLAMNYGLRVHEVVSQTSHTPCIALV